MPHIRVTRCKHSTPLDVKGGKIASIFRASRTVLRKGVTWGDTSIRTKTHTHFLFSVYSLNVDTQQTLRPILNNPPKWVSIRGGNPAWEKELTEGHAGVKWQRPDWMWCQVSLAPRTCFSFCSISVGWGRGTVERKALGGQCEQGNTRK